MLIPVRCFTCSSVIGHKWNPYCKEYNRLLKTGVTEMEACDGALLSIGLEPEDYCCRRMIMGHVNIIDELLLYSNNPGEKTTNIYLADSSSESESEEEIEYEYKSDSDSEEEIEYEYDSESE